jgi:hypothetical protein
MAFLRIVVMFFLDLKSAGVPLVMKMRPPSLSASALVVIGGLFNTRGGKAEKRRVSSCSEARLTMALN